MDYNGQFITDEYQPGSTRMAGWGGSILFVDGHCRVRTVGANFLHLFDALDDFVVQLLQLSFVERDGIDFLAPPEARFPGLAEGE
jgi:prepilin-type processing-associated H-X9-DG protein